MSCFWPAGNPAPIDIPCNSTSSASHCCKKDSVCLSNGYCLNAGDVTPYLLSRGACTDGTWQSDSCPQKCADAVPGDAVSLFAVPNLSDPEYCCDGFSSSNGTTVCALSTSGQNWPFQVPEGQIIWNRTDGSTSPPAAAVLPSNTYCPQPPAASTVIVYRANPSREIAVGAGIGVPIGVLAIALLGALLFQTLQRRRLESALANHQNLSNSAFSNKIVAGEKTRQVPRHHEIAGVPLAELPHQPRV